jgi:hypothetical protein
MNYTQIQDVIVPTKGVGKYFVITLIQLSLPGTSATFYWQVLNETTQPGNEADEQPSKFPGSMVLEGNLTMNEEEYALWGTDDNYVINWALEKLNFQKI